MRTETTLPGIDYLESLATSVKEDKYSLKPIKKVLTALGNPQDKTPSIIVTGTNGKGSVSVYTASILGAAGYRVGLNISPHLSALNERIVVDGVPATSEEISDAALEIRDTCQRIDTHLSFHEAITVCAFLVFASRALDFVVLEVGVGGRLDAANCVKEPVASVLVSVDYDHQAILGDTLEEIALEKAGIFRTGRPAIIGRVLPNVRAVLEDRIEEINALPIIYPEKFWLESSDGGSSFVSNDSKIPFYSRLSGEHQSYNALYAIAACKAIGIDAHACSTGIASAFWPGRLEEIASGDGSMLIDCAHNPAGVASFISYLKARGLADLNVGFGSISTKDWKKMADLLSPWAGSWSLLEPDSEQAVPSEEVGAYLAKGGIPVTLYGRDYERFIQDARRLKDRKTVLLGSIYLVGAVRKLLNPPLIPLWKRATDRSVGIEYRKEDRET